MAMPQFIYPISCQRAFVVSRYCIIFADINVASGTLFSECPHVHMKVSFLCVCRTVKLLGHGIRTCAA